MKLDLSGLAARIKKAYKNLSIKRKLLFVLYIQIIIPILLIGFMSYNMSSRIIQNKSIAYSRDIMRLIELRTNDFIHNVTVLSQVLLYNEKVYDALKYENFTLDPLKEYENEEGISNILKQFIFLRNEIESVCLISNKNKFYIAGTDSEKARIRELIPYDEIQKKAGEKKGKIV